MGADREKYDCSLLKRWSAKYERMSTPSEILGEATVLACRIKRGERRGCRGRGRAGGGQRSTLRKSLRIVERKGAFSYYKRTAFGLSP